MSATKGKIAPFAEIVLCLPLSYVIAMAMPDFLSRKEEQINHIV